jgi:hypothetical protein
MQSNARPTESTDQFCNAFRRRKEVFKGTGKRLENIFSTYRFNAESLKPNT